MRTKNLGARTRTRTRNSGNDSTSQQESLLNKGSQVLEPKTPTKDTVASPKKSPFFNQGLTGLKRKHDKENRGVEAANKENNKGLKKVKFIENDVSQVNFIVNQAKPLKSRKTKNHGGSDASQTKGTAVETKTASSRKSPLYNKVLPGLKRNHGKESHAKPPKSRKTKNNVETHGGSEANKTKENGAKTKAFKSKVVLKPPEPKKEDVVLPLGKPLLQVTELKLPVQDIGAAFQFLEFCSAFSEILDIKNGQPECILRDIAEGPLKHQKGKSKLVQLNIKLLSLIFHEVNKGGDGWLEILKQCFEESELKLKVPMDFIEKGSIGFENLEPSQKLKILNFLCDEVLLTEEMRKFIEAAETKLDEKRKETKERVANAKKKEKLIKQKVKDDMTKAMLSARGGTPLSLSEFDELLSQLRNEADEVHAELTASLDLVHKKNQRSDAVRTDAVILESNGKIFRQLSSYNSSSNIILQDIENWDSVMLEDKWFVYDEEEEKAVEKYICSLRNSRLVIHSSDDAEGGSELDNQESEPEEEMDV